METRRVLAVDAFADEPLGGVGVPVLPEATLTADQLRAVAGEFGAPGAVTVDEEDLVVAGRGTSAPVCAGVGGIIACREHGEFESGTKTVRVEGGADCSVTLDEDRRVTATLEQETEPADLSPERVARGLGIPVSAITDVSVPIGYATGWGGTLLVPVAFLETLGGLFDGAEATNGVGRDEGRGDGDEEPGRNRLSDLPGERVVVYTFDTVDPAADVHARVFGAADTDWATGREWATSGVGASGCGQFLAREGAYEDETEWIRVESGRYCDRPATLDVDLSDGSVGGRGLVALDGHVVVPAGGDDDIVEL